ncbi:RelA/SpoT domain-containing protein [Clostridiaceae bacterium UIB06]|uniref:RelA/SpoT domain-containing protein n=1 Tax=Clostridium thailandense TaxID=2794346 RepID=A0A949TTK6_9CLOT|nr:RelA/SpoT domain-containing protein [Clostridium thailandense]MBV7271636.1 RelA/SpoT domain-containing protein [Clostridium thailandense]MCH5136394.1 RelA/SpoT domain-containing protein [Clostridiaceae bacterium UIB06]
MKNDINEQAIIDFYTDQWNSYELKGFLGQVQFFFNENPYLNKKPFPIIHSVKSRFKDTEHLRDKIRRKAQKGQIVTKENLFEEINDLIGIRVLYLYQDQFKDIHEQIIKKVNEVGDWCFVEEPKAYTWDPESKQYYEKLSIRTELRETYYTSVHYIVKPNNDISSVCCEIQVRTLFEEIWGEIDHTINYPHPTESIACREQLRVLSKLVSTGTRLADSIFRSHNEAKTRN